MFRGSKGSSASRVRAALAAGATTPGEIWAINQDILPNVIRRACIDMVLAGVVTQDDAGRFHPTEAIMTEEAYQKHQRGVRSKAALSRKPPEANPDVTSAVNNVMMAWR